MSTQKRTEFLKLIESNISEYGHHVTLVSGDVEPRFAYTIGLTPQLDYELILAGAIYYMADELNTVINTIASHLLTKQKSTGDRFEIDSLGTFSLAQVHPSWSEIMMLGVYDFYHVKNVTAFQIVPDAAHYTYDVPDMRKAFDIEAEPVWQWLIRDWTYPVPKESSVATNLDALYGEAITEISRWENDEWEMFAGPGPDVEEKDMRVVSLATMLGIDKTILPAIDLPVGKGLWRESADSDWQNWD